MPAILECRVCGRTLNKAEIENVEIETDEISTENTDNDAAGKTTEISDISAAGKATGITDNDAAGKATGITDNDAAGKAIGNTDNDAAGKTTEISDISAAGKATRNTDNDAAGYTAASVGSMKVLLCPYCGNPTVWSQPPVDFEDEIIKLYNTAHRLQMRRQFGEAGKICRKILRLDPNQPEACRLLAQCHYSIYYRWSDEPDESNESYELGESYESNESDESHGSYGSDETYESYELNKLYESDNSFGAYDWEIACAEVPEGKDDIISYLHDPYYLMALFKARPENAWAIRAEADSIRKLQKDFDSAKQNNESEKFAEADPKENPEEYVKACPKQAEGKNTDEYANADIEANAVIKANADIEANADAYAGTGTYAGTEAYPDADANTETYAGTEAYPDADADTGTYAGTEAYPDADADTGTYTGTEAYPDSEADTGTYTGTEAYPDSEADTGTYAGTEAYPDAETYADAHDLPDRITYIEEYPETKAYPDAEAHPDTKSHPDAEAYPDTKSHPDADTDTYAGAYDRESAENPDPEADISYIEEEAYMGDGLHRDRKDNRIINRLLKNAEIHLGMGNYDRAFKEYQELNRRYPDMYEGWYGMLYSKTEEWTDITPDQQELNNWYRCACNSAECDEQIEDVHNKFSCYKEKVYSPLLAAERKRMEDQYRRLQEELDKEEMTRQDILDEMDRVQARYEEVRENQKESLLQAARNRKRLRLGLMRMMNMIKIGLIIAILGVPFASKHTFGMFLMIIGVSLIVIAYAVIVKTDYAEAIRNQEDVADALRDKIARNKEIYQEYRSKHEESTAQSDTRISDLKAALTICNDYLKKTDTELYLYHFFVKDGTFCR